MSKIVNVDYVHAEQASDGNVHIRASAAEPQFVIIDVDVAGGDTMRLRMDGNSAKKLAARIHAAGKRVLGELQERGEPN